MRNIFPLRAIIFSVCLLLNMPGNASEPLNDILLWQTDTPINVYTSATGYDVKTVILQSSMDDLCYLADVIETSELRFKVRISLYPDLSNEFHYTCDGWVDKTQCGVNSSMNTYNDGIGYMYLYSDTTLTAPTLYREFDDTGKRLLPEVLTVLEFAMKEGNRLAKVIFTYNGKTEIGWITRFCTNPFTTCN